MTGEYWLGLLTLPAIALVWFAGVGAVHAVQVAWRRWRPTFIGDEDRRAKHAATLAVARRVLVVTLPGGRVLAWRSTVNPLSDQAYLAWAHVRDALHDAGNQLRPESVRFLSGGDRADRPDV